MIWLALMVPWFVYIILSFAENNYVYCYNHTKTAFISYRPYDGIVSFLCYALRHKKVLSCCIVCSFKIRLYTICYQLCLLWLENLSWVIWLWLNPFVNEGSNYLCPIDTRLSCNGSWATSCFSICCKELASYGKTKRHCGIHQAILFLKRR